MYKAIDIQSQTEIIILDPEWADKIPQLRSLDHADILVCQGCRQPVRVRAGDQRRHHFAHKHLQGCSYGSESPDLLAARAVLYDWLFKKHQTDVTIEKQISDANLPRPVDCWVEKQTSRPIAYWIIDTRLNRQARKTIRNVFSNIGARVVWVHLSKLLHIDSVRKDCIHLSTSERMFLAESEYNRIYSDPRAAFDSLGMTIHYLDSDSLNLTTYRALCLAHPPNVYYGVQLTTPLSEVKVHPRTGEFVHPGEYERLKESKF